MRRGLISSLPGLTGLTRQSIVFRKKMDARVKPAHDSSTAPVGILGRRAFITLIGAAAAAWPHAARAQQPKMLRLGFVGIQPRDAPIYRNLLRRMAELGYQE